jgi:hypothetical protein
MKMRDYLELGLKLLGVYFAVLGIAHTVEAIVSLVFLLPASLWSDFEISTGLYGLSNLAFVAAKPAGYLLCAYLLLRETGRVLRFIGPVADRSEAST